MKKLSTREKSIITGLYLSKFDECGLHYLGFESFIEAFNVIGFSLGVRPASIKNYRDEFDPLFPNKRKGWHKRPIRSYCKAVFDTFQGLQLDEFARLVRQIVYREHEIDILMEELSQKDGTVESSFAKRLITGQAAEEYFKSRYKEVSLFSRCEIEDTTKLGCGFDFRLVSSDIFYGVEVKGMNEVSGNIAMTDKEHAVASLLKDRYFLFVVKNFKEKPFHECFQDPLGDKLRFRRIEQRMVQISWTTKV